MLSLFRWAFRASAVRLSRGLLLQMHAHGVTCIFPITEVLPVILENGEIGFIHIKKRKTPGMLQIFVLYRYDRLASNGYFGSGWLLD